MFHINFSNGNPAQNRGRMAAGRGPAMPRPPEHNCPRAHLPGVSGAAATGSLQLWAEKAEGPSGPTDSRGPGCREQGPGPCGSRREGELKKASDRCGLAWNHEPSGQWGRTLALGPINSKIRAAARGARKGLTAAIIRSPAWSADRGCSPSSHHATNTRE